MWMRPVVRSQPEFVNPGSHPPSYLCGKRSAEQGIGRSGDGMAVQIASWADFGYRKLGPLPASGAGLTPAQVAEAMTRASDYEQARDHWVRRRARRKGAPFSESIEFVA